MKATSACLRLSNAQLVSLQRNKFKFKLEFYQRSSNVRKKTDLTSLLIDDDDPVGRHDAGMVRKRWVTTAQCGTVRSAAACSLHQANRLHSDAATACAEIRPDTVKHCGLRCLGRVDAACNKFDNRFYVVKTDYRLENGLPIFRLPF